MIYITQFVFIKEGQEKTFEAFETVAMPLISKYKGTLLLRLRPEGEAFIETNIERPYEVHLVSFPSEEDFQRFMRDEERKNFLHLKEQSIKTSILIKGERI